MRKKINTLLGIIGPALLFSQVSIGVTQNQNPDAALEINSITNKGLLIPRIILDSNHLNSTISPVKDPKEGLIIYNNNNTKGSFPGFYIWMDNNWQLISSNDNKVSDIVISNQKSTIKNILNLSTTTTIDLMTNINNVEINTIADSTVDGNIYNLPKGNYTIDLTLNLQSEITLNSGILHKDIHNSSYKFSIADMNGNLLSNEYIVNATSSAINNGKHTIYVKMNFLLEESKSIKLQIAKDLTNSTYNSSLYYTEGSIHIRRGISK